MGAGDAPSRRRPALRFGRWIAIILAVMIILPLAGGAFVYQRMAQGPVDIGWLEPVVARLAVGASPAVAHASIDAMRLSRDDDGHFMIALDDLILYTDERTPLATMDRVRATIDRRDFFTARFGPSSMTIDGIDLSVVRQADQRITLDYGERADILQDRAKSERANPERVNPERAKQSKAPPARRAPAHLFQSLTGGPYFREAFRAAFLRNVRLSFHDEATGRRWIARDAAISLTRADDVYSTVIDGVFDLDAQTARLSVRADYALEAGIVDALIDLDDAPVGDLLGLFLGLEQPLFDGLVSGNARLAVSREGKVLSSQFDLAARHGTLHLPGFTALVDTVRLAAQFDPAGNRFDIARLTVLSDVITGKFGGTIALGSARRGVLPLLIDFDLDAEDIGIDHAVMQGPVVIPRIGVAGRYDVTDRLLTISALTGSLAGAALDGALDVTLPKDAAPTIVGRVRLTGAFDKPALMAIWPVPVVAAARRFVSERIVSGTFANLDARFDVTRDHRDEAGFMTDDALSLRFEARDATVIYAPGMVPITRLAGRGQLTGNSFSFAADRGRIGAVRLEKGAVDFPVLRPAGLPSTFTFTAAGDAGDMLSILNDPPLAVLRATRFSPEQFTGTGRIEAQIIRPNWSDVPGRDYDYTATATFPDLQIDGFFRDLTASEANTRLRLSKGDLSITGGAELSGVPVDFNWRQRFGPDGGSAAMTLNGVFDTAFADVFGASVRQYMSGRAPFTLRAAGDARALNEVSIDMDLTDAVLFVDVFGWRKPSGMPSQGRFSIDFGDPDQAAPPAMQRHDTAIMLEGDGLGVTGTAQFAGNWALQSAQIDRFVIDSVADFQLRADQDTDDRLAIDISGHYLDVSRIIETILTSGRPFQVPGGAASPGGALENTELAVRLDRLKLRNNIVLRDASLDMRGLGGGMETLALAARDDNGKVARIDIVPTGEAEGFQRTLTARSDNIGALLSGVLGFEALSAGEGVIEINFDRTSPQGAGAPSGIFEARDLRIVDAPLLARIFAAGSLTGLSDLLNGEGIEISQAFAEFSIDNGTVFLRDARAAGPSLGVSGKGRFDFGEAGDIALNGAVAPLYQINSFLGKTPLIGDLFINRAGEGVIALAYEVSGPAGSTTVFVNPASALTPGFFRRMFEPVDDVGVSGARGADGDNLADNN